MTTITKPDAGKERKGFITRLCASIVPFRKGDDGVAAVEFGMVALPFFAIVFATLEVGIHFFVERTMATGVDKVARQIRVGSLRTGNTVADFRAALCNEAQNGILFLFDCNKFDFDVQQLSEWTPSSTPRDADGNLDTKDFDFAPGGRNTVNMVRVYYHWPAFLNWTGFGVTEWSKNERLFEAVSLFKNEPY